MWTLWRREMRVYFLSPFAYAAAAGYLFLSGVVFVFMTRESMRMPVQLQSLLAMALGFWMPLLAAMLTMRLFAEERQSGTLENLLTLPVADSRIVGAKFLAAFAFMAMLILAATAPVWAILWSARKVVGFDPGGLVGAWIYLVLMSGSAVAVGTLMSLCTRFQSVAALGTVFLLTVPYGIHLALAAFFPEWRWRTGGFPIENHLLDFSRGRLALGPMLAHGSIVLFCLALCTRILESRQWRR